MIAQQLSREFSIPDLVLLSICAGLAIAEQQRALEDSAALERLLKL